MTIKVKDSAILLPMGDKGYYSYIEVEIGGQIYRSDRQHPKAMIDGTYIPRSSQVAYIQYDLVRNTMNTLQAEIFSQMKD